MYHRIASMFALSLLFGAGCSTQESQFRRITAAEYADKMKAGWIGQMAGVGLGAPTEFKFNGRIIPEDQMPSWEPDMVNQFFQDDLYVEMTFLRTLELHGFDVPIRQAGIDFANSRYQLWHANLAGREALRSGIAPPYSGHPQFNPHADDIDYQIEADYSGLIAPGMPQIVIDLAQTFGRLVNYGDGLYGGQFVGAMYAEAFFENDVQRIIQAGLAAIPKESQYHECITDVLGWYNQHPEDWQKTWHLINEKYHENPAYRRLSCTDPDSDFNIDAKINGAYIVMGMLYGKGDADQTMIIATRGGQDSDCNPSNAAGVLFTTIGYSKLPARFISHLDDRTKFSFTEYDFTGLIDVCLNLARQAVIRSGGSIETNAEGEEVFAIPVLEPLPGPAERSWEPQPVPEDIRLTDEELQQITIVTRPPEDFLNVWEISGPYAQEGMGPLELFHEAFEPEKNASRAKWEALPMGSNGYSPWIIRPDKFLGGVNRVAYLQTEVWSQVSRNVILELGSDDGAKIWVNGDLVHENNLVRGFAPAEDRVGVDLKKGWNSIMLKITQGGGDWRASVCLTDRDGNAIKDLKYR